MRLEDFVKAYGRKYSEELSIEPEKEPFKWFLASMLFGARISEKIAINTYREFEKAGLTEPEKILTAGWDELVEILDKGGYVRYDFKTADKLLEISDNLIRSYNGKLEEVHRRAKDQKDLALKLKALGKGVGDITISIFLRELRGKWSKANPEIRGLALETLERLNITRRDIENLDLVNFECALVRLSKNFCRKKACAICPVKNLCKNYRS
jgi:endonuclease III